MQTLLSDPSSAIAKIRTRHATGKVARVVGMALEVSGLQHALGIGERCKVIGRRGEVLAEVTGSSEDKLLVLPFGTWDGVTIGDRVETVEDSDIIKPDLSWIGRVVNAMGEPMDDKGSLIIGSSSRYLKAAPLNAFSRRRVGEKLETKIGSFDVFTPICKGQRMGVFAGSGVGKSSLMSMLARNTNADVIVIGLVGERGREVQDFIQSDLGPEGMARSVIVVATGDEPALMRRQAAWTTMAVAEHFRDLGLQVMVLMDSVTRFAMAHREIGLSGGEPPTTKGYPPTTFSELPRLLERAGPGAEGMGDITGIFTVLVDGGDHDEPIADAVRGIMDGHIVLDRKIGERGRYPAIDLLKSVSRMLPDCHGEAEYAIMSAAKKLLASYEDMQDLIRIGAYKVGTDPETDAAIEFYGRTEKLFTQRKGITLDSIEAFALMYEALIHSGAQVTLPAEQQDDTA